MRLPPAIQKLRLLDPLLHHVELFGRDAVLPGQSRATPGDVLIVTRRTRLIFPLARTAAREPHYQWVQKILDMDVAFATAPGRPKVETDVAARALKSIGVRDGSPMVKDLQGRGYTNLVIVKSSAENARALREGRIDAWYAPVPEVAYNWMELKLPGAPVFGLKLDSAPVYIAASRNTPGLNLEEWRAAYAAMQRDGTLARIFAAYGL